MYNYNAFHYFNHIVVNVYKEILSCDVPNIRDLASCLGCRDVDETYLEKGSSFIYNTYTKTVVIVMYENKNKCHWKL